MNKPQQNERIDVKELAEKILAGNWKELIIPENNTSLLQKAANEFKIKPSQLRKFFEKIKRAKDPEDIIELIPRAKYSEGRKLAHESFAKFIEIAVTQIVKENDEEKRKKMLENFQRGMEYLVAYTKA